VIITENIIIINFLAHSSASINPFVKVLQFCAIYVLLKFCKNLLHFLYFVTLTLDGGQFFPVPKIVFHAALSEIVSLPPN
jgi:hypothetical protein